MAQYDKDEIKKELYDKLKKKVKPEILNKNIDSLVDERIDILETIRKTKGEQIPSKAEMKWWFQDKPTIEEVEVKPGVYETVYEIKIDEICLTDKLASEIFKTGYKAKYAYGEKLDPIVKELLDLYKIVEYSKNKTTKYAAMQKMNNIVLVGAVRYYKLVKAPYFTEGQMEDIVKYFFKVMKLIYDLEDGKHREKTIKGDLYIFAALGDDFKQWI